MVVFVCGSCNDSLKKSGVGLHLSRCRPTAISCCDCGKEFADDSYKEHIKCISEDAKYGPQDQKSLVTQDKGQKKQDEWLNNIKQILTTVNLSGPAEMALNKLLEYPNIPRKKAKFFNFAKSCIHIQSQDVIDQLWSICESANKASTVKEQESQSETNDKSQEETTQSTDEVTEGSKISKKEKKKRKKQGDDAPDPESGEIDPSKSVDNQEQSSEPDQVQDKENSAQSNGTGEIPKKSKKKKKQEMKEVEQEKEEVEETNEINEDHEEIKKTESMPMVDDVQHEESNNEQNVCDIPKKKSKKKKKRNHSETNEDDEQPDNTHQEAGNSDANEDESRKKLKVKEENEASADEKMDQDNNQPDSMSNEPNNDSGSQINWFKQLKRLIKEKQTVEMKEFKKMLKRFKKDLDLDENFPALYEKARIKLMKRHNYSVSDGQIRYQHIF